MTFALMYDDCFEYHRAPMPHPECPERLQAIRASLDRKDLAGRAVRIPARPATVEEISRAHERDHMDAMLRQIDAGEGYLDPDTFYSPGTKRAALSAAGGTVDTVRAVYRGDAAFGFALNRPPGHHACRDRAMGFCLINNAAVAAHALLSEGAERILIFDWDVHHGNGTAQIFYDDPRVLFISVHQTPLFPGTGHPAETGRGAGVGKTVNLSFPAGAGDEDYAAVMERVVLPLSTEFNPQTVLVSAGFDAHERDPIGGMRLTTSAFAHMAGRISEAAASTGRGPCFVLEGGYHLAALAEAASAVVETSLSGNYPSIKSAPSPACERIIDAALSAHETAKRRG